MAEDYKLLSKKIVSSSLSIVNNYSVFFSILVNRQKSLFSFHSN